MKKIGNSLDSILKKINNGEGYLFFQISQKFKKFFPELISFSNPYSIKKGLLFISVDHSAGLNLLQLKREEILILLQKEFSKEEIKEIKFILKKG